MKKRRKKVISMGIIIGLIFNTTIMSVAAEEVKNPQLDVANYESGMELFEAQSEEQWGNSGNGLDDQTTYSNNLGKDFDIVGDNASQSKALPNVQSYESKQNTASELKGLTAIGSVQNNDKEQMDINLNNEISTYVTAGLNPIILNPESLRDGNITTETEIAWFFEGDAAVYYYGGFQNGYITGSFTDAFTTKFYTPGTYTVLCYGEDEAGNQSELSGFNVVVVDEFEAQVFEDSMTSETDSKTYSVNIDFSKMNTAAICLVKTGSTEVKFEVSNESGVIATSYDASYSIPKRWIYIEKPSPDAQICSYNITVKTSKYSTTSGEFRLIVGSKDNTEAMMGGMENAIELDVFRDNLNNYIHSTYVPRGDEYWFVTPMPYPTVLTLLSNNSKLRFKFKDMDTLEDVFDSNWNNFRGVHTTKHIGSYSHAEKAVFEALTGKKLYLVIYNSEPQVASGVLEERLQLGVGQPMYGLTHTSSYGSTMTVGSTSFASQSFNVNSSSIPDTAVMNEVTLSGVSLTKLDKWRVMAPESSYYKESTTGNTRITYNFIPGSQFNTTMKGIWDFGVRLKSGSGSMSVYPTLNFSYYYEFGDRTITIVPAK